MYGMESMQNDDEGLEAKKMALLELVSKMEELIAGGASPDQEMSEDDLSSVVDESAGMDEEEEMVEELPMEEEEDDENGLKSFFKGRKKPMAAKAAVMSISSVKPKPKMPMGKKGKY